MRINYILQINAFNDWVLSNFPSTGQYALYYALLDINNRCGWKEWFAAPNSIIESRTGMTKQGLNKARTYLVDNGLIEIETRAGNQATLYRIKPMGRIVDANVDANVSSGRIVDANVDAELTQMETILKQETKTEKKNAPALYQNVIGMMDTVIAQKMILDIDEYGEDWVCEAIEKAALQNKKTYAYVQGVLAGWKREGKGSSKSGKSGQAARQLPTPEEAKLADDQRKRERQEALRREMFGDDAIQH